MFVYGSLKRGFHNHHILALAAFMGDGTTLRRFDLWSLGAFPAATQPGQFRITGEVYRVGRDTLSELDLLEGEGVLYKRMPTDVRVAGVGLLRAWIYVLLSGEPGMRLITPLSCGTAKAWTEAHESPLVA